MNAILLKRDVESSRHDQARQRVCEQKNYILHDFKKKNGVSYQTVVNNNYFKDLLFTPVFPYLASVTESRALSSTTANFSSVRCPLAENIYNI